MLTGPPPKFYGTRDILGMGEVYLFRTNTRQLPGCFVFRDSGVTRSSLFVPA
jgi:hypothetical protein